MCVQNFQTWNIQRTCAKSEELHSFAIAKCFIHYMTYDPIYLLSQIGAIASTFISFGSKREQEEQMQCFFLSGMQDEEHTKFNIQNLIFWTQKMCTSSFGKHPMLRRPRPDWAKMLLHIVASPWRSRGVDWRKWWYVECFVQSGFCVCSWLLDVVGLTFSLLKCAHLRHPGLACQGLNVCYGLSLHKKVGLSLQSDWLHWCAPTSSKGSKQICNSVEVAFFTVFISVFL